MPKFAHPWSTPQRRTSHPTAFLGRAVISRAPVTAQQAARIAAASPPWPVEPGNEGDQGHGHDARCHQARPAAQASTTRVRMATV